MLQPDPCEQLGSLTLGKEFGKKAWRKKRGDGPKPRCHEVWWLGAFGYLRYTHVMVALNPACPCYGNLKFLNSNLGVRVRMWLVLFSIEDEDRVGSGVDSVGV